MPKSQNQKLKLIRLAQILLAETDREHALTMKRICERLEEYGISAERKSVYDDLEQLRFVGIDVCKNASNPVGYYVAERDFELAELKLLVDAVQSSKFISESKSRALIRKLEGLTSTHEAGKLERQVTVVGRNKTMNADSVRAVDALHEAINSNKKITFKYFDWNIKKEKEFRHNGKSYEISPWALVWDAENYYLIGYDSENSQMRHYRVDKMYSVRVRNLMREGREEFEKTDMAQISKMTFGMFSGEEELVTLECDMSLVGVVIDRFGRDITLRKLDENTFEVSVRVALSPNFYSWVACFAGRMKPTAPKIAVDGYKELLKKALENI